MKTFVLWTHYDCEVYVTLHPTAEAAWATLKEGWLDDCSEDDCGHIPDDMGIEEIANAIEYHWDELQYNIDAYEVPGTTNMAETVDTALRQSDEELAETLAGIQRAPDRNTMPVDAAEALLSTLRTYTGES